MALYDGDMIRHAVCNIDIPACVDETQFMAVMGNVCEALKNLPPVNIERKGTWFGRLIDRDALSEHFKDMQHYDKCACNFPDGRGEPSTNWYCVEDALMNAPSIDALPVEWIVKVRNDADDASDFEMRDSIRHLLDEWLKTGWKNGR